jgi:hypothetical protein
VYVLYRIAYHYLRGNSIMRKKVIAIGFLIILLMTGFVSVSTVATVERTKGDFEAKLGRRGSERPFGTLDGTYHTRNRYYIVSGTARIGDQTGRFRGIFLGNHFIIRLPIGERTIILFGRCNFDENHEMFRGLWVGRGNPLQGWITGTFTPE